jgi:hypothetical protein
MSSKRKRRRKPRKARYFGPNPVSKHAQERMLERIGVEIPTFLWREIISNAKKGYYEEIPEKRAPNGTTCFLIPLGCQSDITWVPMIINPDRQMVVTVLDPLPA